MPFATCRMVFAVGLLVAFTVPARAGGGEGLTHSSSTQNDVKEGQPEGASGIDRNADMGSTHPSDWCSRNFSMQQGSDDNPLANTRPESGAARADDGTAGRTAREADPVHWEYQSFGDFAYRTTNFFEDDFDAIAGWAENRLMYGGADAAQRHRVRPYVKLTLAASGRDYEWANNLVYGIGAEVRPWAHPYSPYDRESLGRQILSSTRFYLEWLEIDYTKTEASGAERDLRIGMDVWREWNVEPIRPEGELVFTKTWAELYAGLAWYDTRFTWFRPEYHALGFDATAWLGVRGPRLGRDTYLMPYLRPEVSWTSRHDDFFWQNRASVALGARVMPFQASSSEWLDKMKVYVEYVRVVDYLRDSATADTPNSDWRVGLAYQLHRY